MTTPPKKPPKKPKSGDAVFGSGGPSAGSVVLGGVEGVLRQLTSDRSQVRMKAVIALKAYLPVGLEAMIAALADPARSVQRAAYFGLCDRPEDTAQQAIAEFSAYRLFEQIAVLEGHPSGVTAVTIATQPREIGDRTFIVSASRDGLIYVWDWEAREIIRRIPSYFLTYTVSIDPRQEVVIAKGAKNITKAWRLRDGKEIVPPTTRFRAVASVLNTHDRYLITANQWAIKVWDLQQAEEVRLLQGHQGLVNAVAVSHDGGLIVSGSDDRTVRLWGIL